MAWLIGRPIGSPAGTVAYLLYYLTAGDSTRSVSPFAREKGTLVAIGETPEERKAEQIYRLLVLRRAPAGSFLGIAARPFLRKLL